MRQALVQAAKVTLPIWILFQLISYSSKQWYAAMDREFMRGCTMAVGDLHPPDVRRMTAAAPPAGKVIVDYTIGTAPLIN